MAELYDLHHGNCLDILPTLPDNSVDLVLTDPPYFRVKGEPWDNQWDDASKFIEWLERVVVEFARVLRPNGSLYLFASPQMAARVELMIQRHMNVLNHIVWAKPEGWWKKAEKETLRGFFPSTERIIFAEHYGADNMAKGEAGWVAKCDELRGFVFEPLWAYLDGERIRAGVERSQIVQWMERNGHPKFVTERHAFSRTQFGLPTAILYQALRDCFHELAGGDYLRREYEDLRREYEDLRREYEDLRRPFQVTADVPYTDVWRFAPVPAYEGKHPCEKPQDLLTHAITASTRAGGVVLDAFMGSGATGLAAVRVGRTFIGIEQAAEHYHDAAATIANAAGEFVPTVKEMASPQLSLLW